jgi:hypothetical protein
MGKEVMKKIKLLHASGTLVFTVLLIFVLLSCDDTIQRSNIVDPVSGGNMQNNSNNSHEDTLSGRYIYNAYISTYIYRYYYITG